MDIFKSSLVMACICSLMLVACACIRQKKEDLFPSSTEVLICENGKCAECFEDWDFIFTKKKLIYCADPSTCDCEKKKPKPEDKKE